MNESETRAELIDPHLKAQGWGVVQGSRIRREYPITQGRLIGQGRRAAPDKADYVLQYNKRNVAVVEATASDMYYTQGLAQAKDYAQRLQLRFAIATNGLRWYMADMQQGSEAEINEVPGPAELWELLYAKEQQQEPVAFNWKNKFMDIPFETKGGTWQPRYYQQNAINAVLDAVAEGRKRILLTLATGTGKTAIAFQIAWKLFNARWKVKQVSGPAGERARLPRILFLADRNILADQAFNAFSAFDEDALVRIKPGEINKNGAVPKDGSVFFTIFQTFMSGSHEVYVEESAGYKAADPAEPYGGGGANFGQYPRDFFDFIIIDECHRGGANDEGTWRRILEYFNEAVQLGLTATPKRKENADTYAYFGNPVYEYSLKAGINDGFLTPFRVKQIDTNISNYMYTPEDTVLEGEVEEGKEYTFADFNRRIEIREREQYWVKTFLEQINQDEKTLVFCASQEHAALVRDIINQLAASKNPNYCQRVTANDGALGERHLRDFQDNEKRIPTILTTSEKLSTGVDAPELRNIVLLRGINSMIEFKQIVGRGTRLYDRKDYFTIYDYVGAYRHFNDAEWDGPPIEPVEKERREEKPECKKCGQWPCVCEDAPGEPCEVCGYAECRCGKEKTMLRVKLADGKVRQLQHMVTTSFWTPDGRPLSAAEFIKQLYGTLPEFFKSEAELKDQWSVPATRRQLLDKLAQKGFTKEQLAEFQKLLGAENADVFDVLSYIAYETEILDREQRAAKARAHFNELDAANRDFLEFVLQQYVMQGVYELDDAKLGDVLLLKYHSLSDAKATLGDVNTIRNNFIGYQRYLYS